MLISYWAEKEERLQILYNSSLHDGELHFLPL